MGDQTGCFSWPLLSPHLSHPAKCSASSPESDAPLSLLLGGRAWGGIYTHLASAWPCFSGSLAEHLNSPPIAKGRQILSQTVWAPLSRTAFPKCPGSGASRLRHRPCDWYLELDVADPAHWSPWDSSNKEKADVSKISPASPPYQGGRTPSLFFLCFSFIFVVCWCLSW